MGCALSGCSWAAERSWHAPSSHNLRRLRLRRRQAWWWMGCRPCLPSSFDRAAVICYRATVASINLWHMHTCTLTITDLPLLCIRSHSFRLERARRNIVYWECLCLLLDLSYTICSQSPRSPPFFWTSPFHVSIWKGRELPEHTARYNLSRWTSSFSDF